jgi:hypothetical protein
MNRGEIEAESRGCRKFTVPVSDVIARVEVDPAEEWCAEECCVDPAEEWWAFNQKSASDSESRGSGSTTRKQQRTATCRPHHSRCQSVHCHRQAASISSPTVMSTVMSTVT